MCLPHAYIFRECIHDQDDTVRTIHYYCTHWEHEYFVLNLGSRYLSPEIRWGDE